MENNFYIKYGNNPEFSLKDITSNLTLLKLDENPSISNVYQNNVMQDGEMWNYTTYQPTTVSCTFLLWFSTWQDYLLAKHDTMQAFMQKELFRIRTDIDKHLVRYVRTAPFTIAPNEDGSHWATFTVAFENPSGVKYSYLRSDQISQSNGWGYGLNLADVSNLNYHFNNQTSFRIFNASDIAVDPYFQKHDLKITIKSANGGLTVKNTTNETSWTFKGSLNSNDTVVLDGINTYKNNSYDSMETDFGYIKLEKGWNEITLDKVADITFSFPFIYTF